MGKKLSKQFWGALIIFSLVGQIAWVVENMYFNVFIYKIFKATATDISVMVAASAITATLTSVFIGALSDKLGKRKVFICSGYILWGFSILAFSLIRLDIVSAIIPATISASAVCISLVIILDCLMTFFGSSANDAAFNAWLTDSTDSSNRGSAEGLNSMMPLIAILVVFGGFMALNLDKIESWTIVFTVIGVSVILIGILGIFLIKEPQLEKDNSNYFSNIAYGFLPKTIKQNKILYLCFIAFIIFNISIQIFMPYLIIYYEVSLGMKDYVLVMAPAIIVASIVTAFWGRVYDKKGFAFSTIFPLVWLAIGYIMLFVFKGKLLVFIGSLFMMSGYLAGMAVFGAKIRDNTPDGKSGRLQGVRIVSQVLLPGIIGPFIGRLILSGADEIVGGDGTYSFIPTCDIFLWALVVVLFTIPILYIISKFDKKGFNNLKTDYEVGDIPLNEYPRPQLKRDSFINLNGAWNFKILNGIKVKYKGEIILPFPPESQLSKVNIIPKKNDCLVYEKTVNLIKGDKLTILNFGAVDNYTKVYVNGKDVGENRGGYLPFSFDITPFINDGENNITVVVKDDTSVDYPYGKQRIKRGGMWYTVVSGIWQTVWIEQVSKNYIKSIKLTPSLSSVDIIVEGGLDDKILKFNGKTFNFTGTKYTLVVDNPILWTPENPHLYEFSLISGEDQISSYFALREISVGVENGSKILLNGKPYFFNGLLDQGYFPDGIYTPASYQVYIRDILDMKELGFNMLRKHIKVEPDIFYYYCDKYGMAVFQDMVNNGKYSFIIDTALPTIGFKRKRLINVTKKQSEIFYVNAIKQLEVLYNHPSILYYTIFNEGWGQHKDATLAYTTLKAKDPTRIYDTASGWFNNCESDVQSEHVYFKPLKFNYEGKKPLVLSEFGGYSYKIEENSFNLDKTYGYKVCNKNTFMNDLESLYLNQVLPNIKIGLSAIVYTQVSDVEDETNGLVTYDRKVLKVDKERMQNISKTLYNAFYEK